jgi:hypothetical protein
MTGCSAHRSSDVAPDLARNGPRPTAASSNSAACQARTKLPFFFLIAGLCGGVVASNIPYFAKFDDLRGTPIGPYFGWPTGPLANWAFIEHLAFWGGIVIALVGVCNFYSSKSSDDGGSRKIGAAIEQGMSGCFDNVQGAQILRKQECLAGETVQILTRKIF